MNKLKCPLFTILFIVSITGFSSRKNAQPVITSFLPASGAPGTLVTITGSELSNPTTFMIGGKTALVISNNGNTLVGMVMPGTITGAISITTSGGTVTSTDNFTVTFSGLPTIQQSSKLVGTNYIEESDQGYSVALSANGNTAIVGGIIDNYEIGAAWIFTRIGSTWSQQGSKLVGTGYTDVNGTVYQGYSVSLSADGNTAIVGGPIDNNIGAAWVFTRSGSTWTQQGSKLVGTGYAGNPSQGASVSLSADGNTAIIGGSADNNNIGAAWVFTRTGSTWTQQGGKLVGTGYAGTPHQGFSVSLSADGNTALIGGLQDNSTIGAVWIFTRSGNNWTQQGSKLVGTGYEGTPFQGRSVSLSADGNTAIIGGIRDNYDTGAAWVFTRSSSTWTQQGDKLVGTGYTGSQIYQGSSVSLSADGNMAIIGGMYDNNNIGAAWIFTRSGGTWTQQGSKLVGTGYDGTPHQGQSVSLSADGNTAIIGGPWDNNSIGSAWVFAQPSGKFLNLKVFLEGPLDTGTGMMSPALNTGNLIPLAQPFNTAPWNYNGTETVASIPNSDIVDWVMVELRQADVPGNATPATIFERRAAFLKSDGTIVDLDGTNSIQFPDFTLSDGNDLYVVIRHPNHLAIMSATGATLNAGAYSYDFTTGLSQTYGGGSGYKQVGSTVAMVSGDVDKDGNIFVSDFNNWAVEFGTTNGNSDADFDLDGNVWVSDYNKWAVNFGSTVDNQLKSAQIIPEQQKPKYSSCVPK